ncbi:hypothetical protein JTE90_006558 [Oedothorax gibbosus]|uniref:Uncharacterized protein n=1 Tax=Oedothorax gibbosus TaxID=931172 RepID=A0AAV6VKF5_9ARAC|nr:hypothetical protein JTE90_006558 [Oedothorax gibbosus]
MLQTQTSKKSEDMEVINDNPRTGTADITETMNMFSSFLLDRYNTSESDTDDYSVDIEDGTLTTVDIQPKDMQFKSNVVLIRIPEHLRSSSDPPYTVATVDRSIPGNTELKGNTILKKIYNNLPKVTPFVEPEPEEEDVTPQRTHISSLERSKPLQATKHRRMRPNNQITDRNYRKPVHEQYVRISQQEHDINPWMPGAEPFIENFPKVNSISNSGSRNLADYPEVPRRPVNDAYGPNRETLPYQHPVSAGYDDDGVPPRYSVDFNEGPKPRYFDDGSQPGFSGDFGRVPPRYPDNFSDGPSRSHYFRGLLRTPRNKYNKPNGRLFRGRINRRGVPPLNGSYAEGPRDPGRDYQNRNSRDAGRFQNKKRFNPKGYSERGHHTAQSATFQNGGEENYVESRPRGRQRPFRQRRRQNF